MCLEPVDLSGVGGTPLWPVRRVCVCIQRGVGEEVCPAEPPLDLESEGVCV